jgi:hypothetical protein
MFSRDQLKRATTLTEEDFVQLGKCRRPHNRLGLAYQVAFVRLFDRFPQQRPFELLEELVCFSAAQHRLDARLIELYRKRQPFLTPAQREEPSPEDICAVLAAVMAHGCNLGVYTNGAADLGRYLRPAQADRRLASDRRGAAERLGAIGKRNRGPRHLLTLGRRQDRGKRRTTVLAAASRSPADLQHPIQRLRLGVLYFRG